MLANFWCETIVFTSPSSDGIDIAFGPYYQRQQILRDLSFGRTKLVQDCVPYPSNGRIFGTSWRFTRVFAIIIPIVGSFLLAFLWLSPCICNVVNEKRWKIGGILFTILGALQALTVALFVTSSTACRNNPFLLNSGLARDQFSDTCRWAWGSWVNVISCVLWAAAGIPMAAGWIRHFERPPPPPPQTQTVIYTQTKEADGTTTMVKDVIKGTYVSTGEP